LSSVSSAFRYGNAVFAEQILKQNCLTLNNVCKNDSAFPLSIDKGWQSLASRRRGKCGIETA